MVVIDATMLMLLFRPDVPARATDSKGKAIEYIPDRVAYLVKTIEASKSRIVIPTPVLSELLVRTSAEETQRILDEINRAAVFRIEPFETRAAIELAVMTRSALNAGDKKGGSGEPWAKVKFDRQIVAIARVIQASTIYTDDANLAATAKAVEISAIGLAELPLPPEAAQGQLPFEGKKPDAIDEIAQQAQTLEEPELPNDPPQ
jgi:predicted nucleic acid-binding protein